MAIFNLWFWMGCMFWALRAGRANSMTMCHFELTAEQSPWVRHYKRVEAPHQQPQ